MLDFEQEMNLVNDPSYQLGTYLYMGMCEIKGHTTCISVAYKMDYCIKKLKEAAEVIPDATNFYINKVKTGELTPMATNKED